MNRFNEALAIQQGACNPSGICRTLVAAIDQARDEGCVASEDPAVRLIVHQLAYVCRINALDVSVGDDGYDAAIAACHERAQQ